MTRICLFALALMSLAALPVAADNQRGAYIGFGGVSVGGDARSPYDEADMPAIELSAGYKYNGLLGIEARWAAGVRSDDDNSSDYFNAEHNDDDSLTEIEREVDQYTAVYYRPETINQSARLYALLGYADMDTSVIAWRGNDDTDLSESLSGPSWGAGVGWFINESLNFNLEYRQLVETDGYRFETFTIQWDYRF